MLPPLPVPPLNHTLEIFIKSMKPLLTENEMAHVKSVASGFFTSRGAQELQEILLARKETEKTSWLNDWWERIAYLDDRSSVCINSNYVHFSSFFGISD